MLLAPLRLAFDTAADKLGVFPLLPCFDAEPESSAAVVSAGCLCLDLVLFAIVN